MTFSNSAREDGLLLRHWRKEHEAAVSLPTTDGATTQTDDHESTTPRAVPPTESDYSFAKYNLQLQIPSFDSDQYNAHLLSEDWSREETEYLLEVMKEYYGKWPVVVDRYDYHPNVKTDGDEILNAAPIKSRSMEEMKSRYYHVCAKMMAVHTPENAMNEAEFATYTKMLQFNPKNEQLRKKHKEALLSRSAEEKREEEYLVGELRRIYLHQERFGAELKDIRERLDHAPTDDTSTTQTFQTSQEIQQLFQKLVAQDRSKKRGLVNREPAVASPAGGAGVSNKTAPPANAVNNHAGQNARGPVARASGAHSRGQLSPRDELRFGVSTHDRLSSGVTFRSDKLNKARVAKSTVQTQKIAGVLAELQIPDFQPMATAAICSAMEKLVSKVNLLLDARKVREKEENEVAIAKQQLEIRKSQANGTSLSPDVKRSEAVLKNEDGSDVRQETADVSMAEAEPAVDEDAEDEDDAEDNAEAEGPDPDDEEADDDEEEEDDAEVEAEVEDDVDGSENDDEADPEQDLAAEDDQDEEGQEEEEDEEVADDDDDDDDAQDRQDSEETREEAADVDDSEEPEDLSDAPAESMSRSQSRGASQAQNGKRSASVLSTSSGGSGTSRTNSKRLRR